MITSSPNRRSHVSGRHSHSFYELGFVLAGRCTWRVGSRRRVVVNSGEALLLKPHTIHAEEIAPTEKAHLAWLGFDFAGPVPAWCQRPVAMGDDAPEITGHFDAIARDHHLTDMRSLTRIGLALQSLLLLLERRAEGVDDHATGSSSLNPRQTHAVESAAHYFRNNLQDPLSVAQVAAYHSLCPGHFSSLFRRQHHVTPRGFLRQARLHKADELLAESELSLKEIAALCGFVDAAHLCKVFKEARRLTPGRFRVKARAKL